MDREPYRVLEDAIDNPGEEMHPDYMDETFMDEDTLKSMLLHGVDEKVEGVKMRLSQKDCEECGNSELQKENLDFFKGRFLCEICYMAYQ